MALTAYWRSVTSGDKARNSETPWLPFVRRVTRTNIFLAEIIIQRKSCEYVSFTTLLQLLATLFVGLLLLQKKRAVTACGNQIISSAIRDKSA